MKFFECDLGAGDAVALAAAARLRAEVCGGVLFPCLKKNLNTVRAIFSNVPEVEVIEVEDFRTMSKPYGSNIIRAWPGRAPVPESGLDRHAYIYQKLRLDYEARWQYCPIRDLVDAQVAKIGVGEWLYPLPGDGGYSFVHDDASRGFNIRPDLLPEKWSRLMPNCDLMVIAFLMMGAKRLDVIDSFGFHLAEQLDLKDKPLFLHRYATKVGKPYVPIWDDYKTKHEWEVLGNEYSV